MGGSCWLALRAATSLQDPRLWPGVQAGAALWAAQVPSGPASPGAAPWDMGGVRTREGRCVCVGRVVSGGKGSDLFAGWREGLRLGVAAGKLGAPVCDAAVFSGM